MPADVLRVLTWNVHALRGDPLAVNRVLAAARPDLACLQEAPRLVSSRRHLAILARRSGLLVACGGRGSAGTAVLASLRAEVHEPREVRLPVAGLVRRPRGYAAARVGLPGTAQVLVVSIHLGLDAGERADHVGRIVQAVREAGLPAVLAGDLNEPPTGPSWAGLAGAPAGDAGAGSGPTFPARAPRRRIDAVLVDEHLEVLEYGFPSGVDMDDVTQASDHLPVAAAVRLPGRPARPPGHR